MGKENTTPSSMSNLTISSPWDWPQLLPFLLSDRLERGELVKEISYNDGRKINLRAFVFVEFEIEKKKQVIQCKPNIHHAITTYAILIACRHQINAAVGSDGDITIDFTEYAIIKTLGLEPSGATYDEVRRKIDAVLFMTMITETEIKEETVKKVLTPFYDPAVRRAKKKSDIVDSNGKYTVKVNRAFVENMTKKDRIIVDFIKLRELSGDIAKGLFLLIVANRRNIFSHTFLCHRLGLDKTYRYLSQQVRALSKAYSEMEKKGLLEITKQQDGTYHQQTNGELFYELVAREE